MSVDFWIQPGLQQTYVSDIPTIAMKEKILEILQTLEAIYFVAQALEANVERLALISEHLDSLHGDQQERLVVELQDELRQAREYYGATAPDHEYRNLLRDARERKGYAYLSKLNIDRHWFQNYEKVFPRWPYVPLHGFVVFDGRTNRGLGRILTLEGTLFGHIEFFLKKAREVRKEVDDFRKRDPNDQLALLACVHAAVTTTFHFIEAYLNGLAYDCFQQHHDELSIEDHDLLAEWDSKEKRRSYVRFEVKLFEYPNIVAKAYGRALDLLGCAAAKILAKEGKEIRDALTHPSPYVDPRTGVERKFVWATGVAFEGAEQIFKAAREYVLAVEQGVGKEPQNTMPWMSD